MGREVRMVPPGWEHPTDENDDYVPLRDGLVERLRERAQWERGFKSDYRGGWTARNEDDDMTADDYFGEFRVEDFMPAWPPEVCTHYAMYENTSEGTPISPSFATPEDLARWLADNEASTFADRTASYDRWLAMIRRGSAPSAVLTVGGLISGVEATADPEVKS